MRSKRHLVDQGTWKKQKNKKNILQSKAYFRPKKSADNNWKFSEPKLKRAIKPSCDCKRSKYSKSSIMCNIKKKLKKKGLILNIIDNIKCQVEIEGAGVPQCL